MQSRDSLSTLGAQDKQASREFLKISALTFMRLGLATASAQAWQPHLPSLGPLVVSSMGERYYKVLCSSDGGL